MWVSGFRETGKPGVFSVHFSESICGRTTTDYAQKVMEGASCLDQLGIKSDCLKDM